MLAISFNGIIVNRALSPSHVGSLEIRLTIPFLPLQMGGATDALPKIHSFHARASDWQIEGVVPKVGNRNSVTQNCAELSRIVRNCIKSLELGTLIVLALLNYKQGYKKTKKGQQVSVVIYQECDICILIFRYWLINFLE